MAVYKDSNGTWRAVYRYTDWTGERKQTQKRGFATKRDAQAWEREQLNKLTSDLDMTFGSFVDIYTEDTKKRLKENTWHTKEHIIRTKILPYFKDRKISDIQAKDIIAWQNEIMGQTDKNGKPYSPVYLKTVHNQMSAIFNHAVEFYGLSANPAAKAGNMGKEKSREMLFWTQDEYKKFSEAVMDKAGRSKGFPARIFIRGSKTADGRDERRRRSRHRQENARQSESRTRNKVVQKAKSMALENRRLQECQDFVSLGKTMLSSKVAVSFCGKIALSRLRLRGSENSGNLAMLGRGASGGLQRGC